MSGLDPTLEPSRPLRRLEIINGIGGRRRWLLDDKARIIEETLAVVRAKGIALVDDDPMASIKEFCTQKFNKPSMLQHMEAGKRTEVDSLNGAVVAYGRALGIPTPYNEALTWMVKGMEEQRRRLAAEGPFDYAALEAAAAGKKRA